MEVSLVGATVCVFLIVAGLILGAPVITAFMMSLAFGATALATLPVLGDTSPLVFTLFAGLLIVSVALRQEFIHEVADVFRRYWEAWVVFGLCLYVLAGSFLLPRLFRGMTTVFVAGRGSAFLEAPLGPVSGNLASSFYFLLGGLVFIAVCVLLRKHANLLALRRGFFAWAVLHSAFGILDLAGKHLGAGDLLAPLRTATYAMLTNVQAGQFYRIAGAYPEASTFGAVTLGLLAFTVIYWRRTGSRGAFILSWVLFALLLLSTSTTAYGGLAIMSVFLAASILGATARQAISRQDVLLAFAIMVLSSAVLAVHLFDARFFDPAMELVDSMVLNKAASASAVERGYWNERSIQALFDTSGLGIGIGSSRASSWIIAVLSQIGVPGAILMTLLVGSLVRGPGVGFATASSDTAAIVSSVRACALGLLVSASLSGGSADPGIVFFVALAAVVTARKEARLQAAESHASPSLVHARPPSA